MKDLEKIKSEDLAAQVQDANPANFAIEQEVAQLVGATVPAPTEPSADDARELGAQLLVFLRRALLPIQTALRTAVAAIYAHLDSRCTDYTPAAYAPYLPLPSYDPMGTPPTPRTLPNLLTALTAFDGRKISNGSAPSDGIKDGISLARLLFSTTDANLVTKIVDDTPGWVANKAGWLSFLLNNFPNATYFEIGCTAATATLLTQSSTSTADVHLKAKTINFANDYSTFDGCIWFDDLETCNVSSNTQPLRSKKLSFPSLKKGSYLIGGSGAYGNEKTQYVYLGCMGNVTDTIILAQHGYGGQTQALAIVEVRQGARQRITLQGTQSSYDVYPNMTAANIVNYIFEKLADNSDGDAITINIGSVNLAKLTDEQKAIAQNKNYTLA